MQCWLFLVLILSLQETLDNQQAAPSSPKKLWNFEIVFGKGFLIIWSNFLGLDKQVFHRNYLTILHPSFK